MFGWLRGLDKEPKEEYHIITAKDVIYSPLSPSEFFKANHDEIHLGHIEFHAFFQLAIGMMDQMAEQLVNK